MEPSPGWHLERRVASNIPNGSSSAPDCKLSTGWTVSLVGSTQPWGIRCLGEAIRSPGCIPPNHLGLGALERAQSIKIFRVIFYADQRKLRQVVLNSGGPSPPLKGRMVL